MIHSEVKTCADALASTVKSIDAQGQLPRFLPYLIGELGAALLITERELRLHCWELEDEKSK